MKKILLSLLLLGPVLLGNTQTRDLWFNELVPWPGGNDEEYIELYNTSSSEINLDCYILVSMTPSGAYVYNFPSNARLRGLSYYLLSSDYNVDFKAEDKDKKTRYTFTASDPHASNWNAIGTGGSILFYSYNSTTKTWATTGTSVGNNFRDFIHNDQVSLLIYKINPDGTVSLVNGFFSKEIPATVTSRTNLTIPSTSCGPNPTVSLVFDDGNITQKSTEIGPASGNQQGYSKIGNGICGNWVKTQNKLEFTPAKQNPLSIGTIATGSLTTSQVVVCGNRIDFSVAAPTASNSSAYPVEVHLYIDNNKDGLLDASDTYLDTYDTLLTGGTDIYSFVDLPAINSNTQQFLIIYKTALGCFDAIAAPAPVTGSVNTTQVNVCGSRIDYSVTDVSGDASKYGSTINIQIYRDLGTPGVLDGLDVLMSESLSQPVPVAVTAYDIPVEYKNSSFLMVYTMEGSCFRKVVSVSAPTVTLTTSQIRYCNKLVEATITAASPYASELAFPVTATAFYDNDNDNVIDAGEQIGVKTINSLNETVSFVTSATGTNVKIQYTTSACSGLGNRTDAVTPATSEQEAANAAQNTIEVNGNISPALNGNNKREVSYFIVNGATTAGAYPILIKIIEDVNENGVQDAGEIIIGTKTVNSEVASGTPPFTVELQNANSAAILLAESLVGCTSAFYQVTNSNSVLPVSYASFTATRTNNSQVVLDWVTATEEANRGFHVQRNDDGTWKNVGFVASQANGGNSTAELKYTFKDANSNKGISQYRVLQVDMDGKGRYSEVRSVHGVQMAARVVVFPNPSHTGSFSLLFEEGSSVRDVLVSDVSGRQVKQFRNATGGSLTVDGLTDGFYSVQILNRTTGTATVEKVIIKKR